MYFSQDTYDNAQRFLDSRRKLLPAIYNANLERYHFYERSKADTQPQVKRETVDPIVFLNEPGLIIVLNDDDDQDDLNNQTPLTYESDSESETDTQHSSNDVTSNVSFVAPSDGVADQLNSVDISSANQNHSNDGNGGISSDLMGIADKNDDGQNLGTSFEVNEIDETHTNEQEPIGTPDFADNIEPTDTSNDSVASSGDGLADPLNDASSSAKNDDGQNFDSNSDSNGNDQTHTNESEPCSKAVSVNNVDTAVASNNTVNVQNEPNNDESTDIPNDSSGLFHENYNGYYYLLFI